MVDLKINSYYHLPSARISLFNPSKLLCNISIVFRGADQVCFSAPIVPFKLCQLQKSLLDAVIISNELSSHESTPNTFHRSKNSFWQIMYNWSCTRRYFLSRPIIFASGLKPSFSHWCSYIVGNIFRPSDNNKYL